MNAIIIRRELTLADSIRNLREESILGGIQFTISDDCDLETCFESNRELDDAIYAAQQHWAKFGYFTSPAVDYRAVIDATACPECYEAYLRGVLAGKIDLGCGEGRAVRMVLDSTEVVRGRVVMVFLAEVSE